MTLAPTHEWICQQMVEESPIAMILAVRAISKGGRRISIEFNVALLRASTGEMLGAAAMIQDVTARWERDKALRQRLTAAEAKLQEIGKPREPEAGNHAAKVNTRGKRA